jgi:hypothetical protein
MLQLEIGLLNVLILVENATCWPPGFTHCVRPYAFSRIILDS